MVIQRHSGLRNHLGDRLFIRHGWHEELAMTFGAWNANASGYPVVASIKGIACSRISAPAHRFYMTPRVLGTPAPAPPRPTTACKWSL